MSAIDWLPYIVLILAFAPRIIQTLRGDTDKDEASAMAANNAAQAQANTALVQNTGAVVDMVMGQARELKQEIADLRARMERVEIRERVHRQWNEMLSRQVIDLGGKPTTYEQAARAAGIPIAQLFETSYQDLRREMLKAFDKSELNLLARDIGISPDEIAGDALSDRTAELVAMASRRGLMKKLQEAIRDARSNFPPDALDLL